MLNGYYIISAPHTIKVDRLGENHIPEINIKKILYKLEKKIGAKYISTITWKTTLFRSSKKKQIDPNYYPTHKLKNSPWYQYLESKKEEAQQNDKVSKLFLIDLHGMNDKKEYDIIIGFQALKNFFPKEESGIIITNLLDVMEKFSHKYKLRIGYNIIFKGFINEKFYTVSQQSNSLGIPAIQMEISKKIRNKLVNHSVFFSNFAKTLLNFYKLNQKYYNQRKPKASLKSPSQKPNASLKSPSQKPKASLKSPSQKPKVSLKSESEKSRSK